MVARGAGGVTAEHAESVPCNTHRGWPLALRCACPSVETLRRIVDG